MGSININGNILNSGEAVIKSDDHSYRYGNGLFETMKISKGVILREDLHFERLFNGLSILKMHVPKLLARQKLENEIIDLCKKNSCEELARVRLSISGGAGGLYDNDEKLKYLIECWPLQHTVNQLNENGAIIDVFDGVKKSCDIFSNLKSASHLPYVMAARFAKEHKLNDCLLLNIYDRVCDSTIANIFWIKGTNMYTPPLDEGCIAGVMRRFLLDRLQALSYTLQEKNCEIADLENADEVFLTNAIQEIKWVKQFRNKNFVNTITKDIHSKLQE